MSTGIFDKVKLLELNKVNLKELKLNKIRQRDTYLFPRFIRSDGEMTFN